MPPSAPRSIWSPALLPVTIGAIALIVLSAFESLAVTTVMPVVSAELDGAALYALAFAGTLASAIIGMIAIGTWCDRSGPLWPLTTAVALFIVGLLLAGFADSMSVLVLGRIVQGLGSGGQTVALYVIVARLYPPALNGRVFAAFATAWVVPSLVGPFVAGAVAEHLHWRWVFLGVAVLTVIAYGLIFAKLRHFDTGPNNAEAGAQAGYRLLLACAVAILAMLLALSGDAPVPWNVVGAIISVALIAIAVRPLLPAGTLRAARGLPSVILQRGVIAGTLIGAETYLPYLLREVYDFTPTFSGLALTGSAVTWAIGANVQGRIGDHIGNRRTAIIGTTLLSGGVLLASVVVFVQAPAWLLIATWCVAGLGIGLIFPRTTVLTLAYSTPQNQGFNSSALSISDSLGCAAAVAVLGLILAAIGPSALGFGIVLLAAGALGLVAFLPGLRLGHAAEAK